MQISVIRKISYARKFDSDYVAAYKEKQNPDFGYSKWLDITELSLVCSGTYWRWQQQSPQIGADSKDVHPEGEEDKGSLVMTDYEYQKLQNAYEETMRRTGEVGRVWSREEYL
ncbi:MAG: hypothetical protein ACLU6Y_02030 [Ruminococcus sp.]